jgi:hypothetical protein
MTFLFALVMACGGADPAPPATPAPAPKAPVAVATAQTAPDPTLVEALKTADAADGTEDKVATKCAGCALAMDGDAAHSVSVDGYTLHLCSASCKSHFSTDVAGNLKKLLN